MSRIYIASAWRNGHYADTIVKPAAEARGLTVVSTWHDGAPPPERAPSEDLPSKPIGIVRRIADTNDRDLASADGVVVIWHHEAGETFAEMTRALLAGKPVAYVGPRYILSAFREGVERFSYCPDALTWLAGRLGEVAS